MASSICLGLGLTEVVLRAAPNLFNQEIRQMLRADPRDYGVAHPYIGHLHKPNNAIVLAGRDFHAVHHVDGLGFRNSWPWPDRAEIVTVGDSVTFSQCVADDQAWPYLLARSLTPNRVINLGLVGAGPQQYVRLFETFGAKLRPKLLLVGVFPQNDFWDAGAFDSWARSGVGGNFMVWRDFGRPERRSLSLREPLESLESLVRARVVPVVRSSYLYTLLRALRGGMEGDAPTPPRILRFADGTKLELRESDFVSKSELAQPGRREFALLADALEQIHSLATRHGARALILLLPGKEQVYLPLVGGMLADPTSGLRTALELRGVEYLDLEAGFRVRAAAGERLFYEADVHPNPAGQALIAELVSAHLVENAARYGLMK
jgi:lysophospholipase L1-like esterase